MSFLAEGGSISRPSLLDGLNYPYWKARIKAFIKALDEKAWRSALSSWKHPTTKDDKGNVTLTSEVKWSGDDNKLANYKSKVLNAIFNSIGANQIKLITTCESAKEA